MSLPSFRTSSWNGRHLKITRVTPQERAGIVRDAIAKKAYKISESRGFAAGHELEDWRQAESEMLLPLNCGFLVLDRSIELRTDAECFGAGEIEICVEPRHLTICGKESPCPPEAAPKQADEKSAVHSMIRSLQLPLEIDPSQVSARFRGRMIEIDLPKGHAKQKAAAG